MTIDAHAHLYDPSWYPAKFSQRLELDYRLRKEAALSTSSSVGPNLNILKFMTDSSGEKTLKIMDRIGLEKRVILILDFGLALGEAIKTIRQIHHDILSICQRFRDRLIGFAGVDPRRLDAVTLLQWAFDTMDAKGLKLHPTSEWSLLDDCTMKVVEVASQRHRPILVHVGRTIRDLSERHSQPAALIALAAEFPNATFIAGHSGFESWKQFKQAGEPPANIYFDISGWQEILAADSTSFQSNFEELTTAFPGRVLFGSDSPFFTYNLPALEQRWLGAVQNYSRGLPVPSAAGLWQHPILSQL